MLMVDLMIIILHLKLNKFYCIGALHYDLFFCSYKNELLFFNREELLQKTKDIYHNGGRKKSC